MGQAPSGMRLKSISAIGSTRFPTKPTLNSRPPMYSWTSTSSNCSVMAARSEEHTSELQSQFQLVCRLLLEKKILAHSSNVGMVQVAERISPQVQYQYFRAFGIGAP